MVILLVLLLFPSFFLEAEPPQDQTSVSAEVQWENIYENEPIEGFVSVTHDQQFKVDVNSFKVGKSPLSVNLEKEVKISDSSPLVISIYKFTIPGMAKGLQLLPEISVKVGSHVYKSAPVSFQVQSLEKRVTSNAAFLKLETISPQKTLYPGTRTQVGYRYLYNTNIELTEEYLPLLDAVKFKKIGDKDIRDDQRGLITVHTILQNIEALAPGIYKFGPSVIIGNAYQETAGKRVYLKPELTSEAPVVALTVEDFPLRGRPTSFNGAVGEQYTFEVFLDSAKNVRVGDAMHVRLVVKGSGQLETVRVPDLCCQPGFSGLFKISDLPTVGKVVNNSKIFELDIFPLFAIMETIPPIEFSYFNPVQEKYVISISKEIPIKVSPAPASLTPQKETKEEEKLPMYGNYTLQASDLRNRFFGTMWVLGLVPAGLICIFFQMAYIQEKKQLKGLKASSSALFKMALNETKENVLIDNLKKAFLLRLYEKGFIENPHMAIEDLSDQFIEIKELFYKVDSIRFSTDGTWNRELLIKEAKMLWP